MSTTRNGLLVPCATKALRRLSRFSLTESTCLRKAGGSMCMVVVIKTCRKNAESARLLWSNIHRWPAERSYAFSRSFPNRLTKRSTSAWLKSLAVKSSGLARDCEAAFGTIALASKVDCAVRGVLGTMAGLCGNDMGKPGACTCLGMVGTWRAGITACGKAR